MLEKLEVLKENRWYFGDDAFYIKAIEKTEDGVYIGFGPGLGNPGWPFFKMKLNEFVKSYGEEVDLKYRKMTSEY